ncbi:helix-turn-helix domain-containing protein [Streptomyces sp. NPDC048527]|uniref:helix-turn-helix domain-containing protein n=1 Tax=Streptomyces sp. NPDC048527 TaxID=3365568 RepID=UPI00371422CC
MSQVLLPVFALVRRADLAEVIGTALAAKASGAGVRVIAARLGRPVETVRGWLRRFASRAEAVRHFFTVVLVDTGVDPAPPGPVRNGFADAVNAVVGAWWSAAERWPGIGKVSPWWAACAMSGGILLAPSWPSKLINTNRP